MITDNEWNQFELIKEFIELFKEVTIIMSGSKYSTLTMTIPLYNELIDHIEDYTRRMKKISKNWQSFLARKAMHIYKSTILFLPILGYFWLFLPICESVANLHKSTLLFALNIHAYFCLFFII